MKKPETTALVETFNKIKKLRIHERQEKIKEKRRREASPQQGKHTAERSAGRCMGRREIGLVPDPKWRTPINHLRCCTPCLHARRYAISPSLGKPRWRGGGVAIVVAFLSPPKSLSIPLFSSVFFLVAPLTVRASRILLLPCCCRLVLVVCPISHVAPGAAPVAPPRILPRIVTLILATLWRRRQARERCHLPPRCPCRRVRDISTANL